VRVYTNVNKAQGTSTYFAKGYEYVSGYADIDYGSASYNIPIVSPGNTSGYYDYGRIKLSEVPGGDHLAGLCCGINANPISKAAWQFARIHTPRQAYNGARASP